MITLREAVARATDYVVSAYKGSGVNIQDVLLEEAELSDNQQIWLITIGFSVERSMTARTRMEATAAMLRGEINLERIYKLVHVNAETGEVQSMKMRLVTPYVG